MEIPFIAFFPTPSGQLAIDAARAEESRNDSETGTTISEILWATDTLQVAKSMSARLQGLCLRSHLQCRKLY